MSGRTVSDDFLMGRTKRGLARVAIVVRRSATVSEDLRSIQDHGAGDIYLVTQHGMGEDQRFHPLSWDDVGELANALQKAMDDVEAAELFAASLEPVTTGDDQ